MSEKNYMVLEANTRSMIEAKVRSNIIYGWEPQGGISVVLVEMVKGIYVAEAHRLIFFQAMVKKGEQNDPRKMRKRI